MKRKLLIVVACVALLAGGAAVYWRSRAVQRDVFRSPAVLATLTAASDVTAERLHYRHDSPQNPFRLDSYEHEAPVVVPPTDAQQIQRLLLQRSSYVWESAKACAPNYGLVFTLRRADALVRVALCFECDTLGIYDSPEAAAQEINREGDFDPKSAARSSCQASLPERSRDTTAPVKSPQTSNHAMERTATRRAFTFSVTSAPPLRATRALGGRRSSCSR